MLNRTLFDFSLNFFKHQTLPGSITSAFGLGNNSQSTALKCRSNSGLVWLRYNTGCLKVELQVINPLSTTKLCKLNYYQEYDVSLYLHYSFVACLYCFAISVQIAQAVTDEAPGDIYHCYRVTEYTK